MRLLFDPVQPGGGGGGGAASSPFFRTADAEM